MPDVLKLQRAISRRSLLKGFGLAGVAATGVGVAGCSDSGSGSTTVSFSNYQGWIGPHTVAKFEARHPGSKIHQVYTSGSFNDLIPKLKAQPGLYDMALASIDSIARAKNLGLIAEMDFSSMPNLTHIERKFIDVAVNSDGDYFVPTDNGKVGIGVRTDLVDEKIDSWADLWRLAPKYDGKLYVYDYDKDLMGTAMLYLGHKVNTRDPADIKAAGAALQRLKPHIGSITTNGIPAALVDGTAALAITYDYEVFAAHQKNPHVRWVAPAEGMTGYLEGWVALAKSKALDAVQEFTNFAFAPKYYADFVKANSVAYVENGITDLLPKAISASPILFPPADVLSKVTFEQSVGDAEPLYSQAYTAFKAAK